MARDENTELTIAEARISALTTIITGVAFTSDRLDRIDKERLRLLSLAAKLQIISLTIAEQWQFSTIPNIRRK